MLDFKTENTGNRVVINTAPFRDVVALKNELLKEFIKYPLGLKLKDLYGQSKGQIKDIFNKELDFTEVFDFIKNVLISSDTSDVLNDKIFNCLKYCTYNTAYKIDKNLFDDVKEARADYYEIIFACIKENLRPFMKSLVSELKKVINLPDVNQLLMSEQEENSK